MTRSWWLRHEIVSVTLRRFYYKVKTNGNSVLTEIAHVFHMWSSKTHVIFSHVKHVCLGHVFYMWNFTCDFSHVFHMWNFTCEISHAKFHMGNFIHEKSHVIFHMCLKWLICTVLYVNHLVWILRCEISHANSHKWNSLWWKKSQVKFLIIWLFTF